ncbi:MAG TPA: SIS domain-containing protein [Aggregatilineaceae bacterium]|nr:SIS domain-containing protein [Aggregatilineaceae bacterium]
MYSRISDLIHRYSDLTPCAGDITAAFEMLKTIFEAGGKLLICGNGGSAADSEHIVGELMKGFRLRRPLPAADRERLSTANPDQANYLATHLQGALPAVALVGHSSLFTAFINDVAADMVFAQQVYGLGRPGDALLSISTSGNASNVLNAVRVARAFGLHTLGLTGPSGGTLRELCDVTICVPGADTAQIQEHHLPVYHTLCSMLEETFFGPPQ